MAKFKRLSDGQLADVVYWNQAVADRARESQVEAYQAEDGSWHTRRIPTPSLAKPGDGGLVTDPLERVGAPLAGNLSRSVNPASDPSSSVVRSDLGRMCGASNTAHPSQVRETATGISVDWLTVRQTHGGAFVKVGDSVLLFCDLATGEVKSEAIRGMQHRGSHDSSLQVRCDGRTVEVSGNPSKWGRYDNLFGCGSVREGVEVFNRVLLSLGLPEFEESDRVNDISGKRQLHQFARSDAVMEHGAVVTRVDLCRNWSAGGAAAARSVVAALGSVVRMGKCGWLSPDGNTVAWGVGSRRVYTKYYIKAAELLKHPGADAAYAVDLAAWCESVGLVRQEVSFKAMELKRRGLARIGAWDNDQLPESLLDEYSPHRECGATCDSVQDLYRFLLVEIGVSKAQARAAQMAAEAYRNGYRFIWKGPGANISRSAFYRLKANVEYCGIDLAAPLNVSTLPVRIRTLVLSPAVAPDWYRWAG